MNNQKTRSEIDNKYKWDLSKVYSSDQLFYNDLDNLKNKLLEYDKYKNSLFNTIDNFKSYLLLDEEVEKLFNKLFTYSQRKNDEDTTNVTYQKMVQEMSDTYSNYSIKTSFFLPLLYNTDKTIIDKYLEDKDLIKYKKSFDELLRFKKYTLSSEKEKLISMFDTSLSSSDNTYSILTDADITFPSIKDEEGNLVELTESNYSIFIRSRNRQVRMDAFNALFEIYTGHINSDIAITKIRGYNSTMERFLFPDKIDKNIYLNLIDTVSNRRDVINNYFDTIKNCLGVEELHRYDTYTSLIDNSDKKYSFEDAKEIVLKALNVLGDEYKKYLNEAFNGSWIDVYNNKGKRSGAYSAGNYDTVPYILLNYEGTLNDVSTLAHELGHSIHTYYSCKNNDRLYADYKIFVAEVASTTNELLLNDYLLKNSNDNEEKLTILNNLMNLYYATIIRQTMFAEFEKIAYELRENEKPLTHEILEDTYYNLCKKYFGDEVIMDDNVKYEWERIPHFYYGFYVYKYATSLAASTYISEHIIKDKTYLDKYIKFLSSGSSMDPLDELKIVDVDLNKKEVINEALDKFNYYIEEFKRIYEINKK